MYIQRYHMTIDTEHEKSRQVRGLAIASIGSCIKRINKLRYKVKSQSDAWKWYEYLQAMTSHTRRYI
jgi:hypothetical protein